MIAALALAAAVPLTCGAVSRPGLAELGADGVWHGRAVELCRAAAAAEGAPGIAFRTYDDTAGLRGATDRIAFLTAEELALATALTAGPIVAIGRQSLVVPPASPARAPGDLAGKLVCFIIGTRAEDALNETARRERIAIERIGFQERDEMADGFASGKCAALAIDAADPLAPAARTLAPALAETPIMAATPAADPGWTRRVAAIVAAAR